MTTTTTTRAGHRLYVRGSLAFLARDNYVSAWGMHSVAGALFDLEAGTIQRNAVAWCNIADTEANIVTAAMIGAGA